MKPCYLQGLQMYLHCKDCPATPDKMCYATREEVILHLEEFNRLRLDFDNGTLEDQVERFEDMFTIHQGGFI